MSLFLNLAFVAIAALAWCSAARDLWRAAKAWREVRRALEREEARKVRYSVRQLGKGSD